MVGGFGRSGRNAGHFHWVHSIAVDSKGNIYTGEVDNGKRVQKFKPNGTARPSSDVIRWDRLSAGDELRPDVPTGVERAFTWR